MTQYFPVGSVEGQYRYDTVEEEEEGYPKKFDLPILRYRTSKVSYLTKTGRHVYRNGIPIRYRSRAECNSFRKNMGMGTFHQVNTGGPLFSGIPPRDGHFNQTGREVRASVFHVRSPSPRVEDKRAAIMHGGKTLQTQLKQNKIHTTPRWERQSQRPSISIIDSSCFISSPDRNIGCSSFYGDMKTSSVCLDKHGGLAPLHRLPPSWPE